jgi:hypothetical protein
MPDGRIARFEVPDGTTPEQAQSFGEQYFSGQPAPARGKFDLRGDGFDRAMNYDPTNANAGAVRGAASFGASLLSPFESKQANDARRASFDPALTQLTGSDPNSTPYKTTKLATEVLGTSGVGGLIAKGLRAIPGVANALPTLIPAIESGGMSANGAKGLYGAANRIAGGAVNGAATAGLVDPEQAKAGAVIGAATPAIVQAAGRGMEALSAGAPKAMNPTLAQTAKESIDAGYVIPPNMVKPSLKSQVLESISGKQATQQIASTRNTATTEKLVRQSLGIADDVPLTKATLDNLRKTAGTAYSEVASLSPQAAADLEALKQARNDAQTWFNAYNRSANPEQLSKAKEFRETAQNLENWLEFHAAEAGKPELIPALQRARKEIAKTYTVERALNDAAGTVDARVLGRMYEKGSPLSDGLDTAGKFASAFPTVAKSPQQVGSPAAHNLKSFGALLMGAGGAGAGAGLGLGGIATGGLGLGLGALPFVAPPLARAAMFSNTAQRGLLDSSPGLLNKAVDEALPLMYRVGPLLSTSGA